MSLAGVIDHVEPRIRKHWLERRRGAAALLILAPFLYAALLTPAANEPTWAASLWKSLGWLLFLAGAIFRLMSTLYIGGRKGEQLVTEGPYSITRNPLYFGTLLIALSSACFLESGWLALGVVPATIAYLGCTLASERRRLTAKHGLVYLQYCERVPALMPNLKSWQSSEVIEVDSRCLKIELLRSLRWFSLPLAALLLNYLRSA